MVIIMKKKMALLAAVILLAGSLSACGKEAEYVREITASDYVELGEYKGIEVTVRTTVEIGDTVNIDYTGYRDGVAFDRGAATGQSLTIGSGTFIPGFEDGLIGKKVGETVMLDLTFPADYKNEEMAGAEVTFEVVINDIENESDIIGRIMQTVMANCIFQEPPEEMVTRYCDMQIKDMTAQLAAYGMDLNTYMQTYFGMDSETYMAVFREDAAKMAQQYIMFQAIADAENLNLTDEEIAAAMEEHAAAYGYESVENFKEEIGEEVFYEYLMAERIIDFLEENAVIHTEQ